MAKKKRSRVSNESVRAVPAGKRQSKREKSAGVSAGRDASSDALTLEAQVTQTGPAKTQPTSQTGNPPPAMPPSHPSELALGQPDIGPIKQKEIPFATPTQKRNKLAEVPCIEMDETGLGWTLKPLPHTVDIRQLFSGLLHLPWVTDRLPMEDWWEVLNPGRHVLPSTDWVDPLNARQSRLLREANTILHAGMFGSVVQAVKMNPDYPQDWGWRATDFRSTTERLFDRLRLNGIVKGDIFVRQAQWTDLDGKLHSPRTTVFGIRKNDQPFYKLRMNLATDGRSVLGRIVGLTTPPDSFSLPLDWSMARRSGLSKDIPPARLGAQQRSQLKALADAVDDIIDGLRKGQKTSLTIALISGAIGNALRLTFSGFGLVGTGAALLTVLASGLAKSELKALEDAIAHVPDNLRNAADKALDLNDVARILTAMVDRIDIESLLNKLKVDAEDGSQIQDLVDDLGVLFGLEASDLDALVEAFGGDAFHAGRKHGMPPGWADGLPEPMILLGSTFIAYAEDFGEPLSGTTENYSTYVAGKDAPDTRVVTAHLEAHEAWTAFWNAAKPTVDVAKVFDLSGIIVERLVYLDDMYLALNDLVLAHGLLGDVVQTIVADQGLERFVDALGGASPGSVLRYVVRQVLTDLFIEDQVVDHDVDRDCLHTLFCWMNSRKKRDAIEAALGPVVDYQIPGSDLTLPVRASIAPGINGPATPLPSGLVARPITSRDEGALANIFRAITQDSDNVLEAIDSCDLATLRDWLVLARKDCLEDLRSSLEPKWEYPETSGTPKPPTRDDVELPGNVTHL